MPGFFKIAEQWNFASAVKYEVFKNDMSITLQAVLSCYIDKH